MRRSLKSHWASTFSQNDKDRAALKSFILPILHPPSTMMGKLLYHANRCNSNIKTQWIKRNSKLRIIIYVILLCQATVTLLSKQCWVKKGSTEARRHAFKRTDCLIQRGMTGKWVQDWDYANRTNYIMGGSYSDWHLAGERFTPTQGQPFRLATSWKWQDDVCPVHETSLQGFCEASHQLNLTRYLIMGDSMSAEFTYSLLHLLGVNMPKWRTGYRGVHKPFKINCDFAKVVLWHYKRSPLYELLDLAMRPEPALQEFVLQNAKRTAIVANSGAWIGTLPEYQQGFDSFLQWIDSFDPSSVLVFYRPTLPGHLNCLPSQGTKLDFDWKNFVDEIPYRSYDEYRRHSQHLLETTNMTAHNWFEIESFNAYSQQVLQGRSTQQTHIYWLNVFPSGVLRRDGHVGFNDCLHYYLPGPPDWWVHLFYSMLLDLSSVGEDKKGDNYGAVSVLSKMQAG